MQDGEKYKWLMPYAGDLYNGVHRVSTLKTLYPVKNVFNVHDFDELKSLMISDELKLLSQSMRSDRIYIYASDIQKSFKQNDFFPISMQYITQYNLYCGYCFFLPEKGRERVSWRLDIDCNIQVNEWVIIFYRMNSCVFRNIDFYVNTTQKNDNAYSVLKFFFECKNIVFINCRIFLSRSGERTGWNADLTLNAYCFQNCYNIIIYGCNIDILIKGETTWGRNSLVGTVFEDCGNILIPYSPRLAYPVNQKTKVNIEINNEVFYNGIYPDYVYNSNHIFLNSRGIEASKIMTVQKSSIVNHNHGEIFPNQGKKEYFINQSFFSNVGKVIKDYNNIYEHEHKSDIKDTVIDNRRIQ